MRAQVLDSMDLERERGITIKAQAVRVLYEARDGETYQLHLIDTPGHVDFTYEVSRSLAACEGALLVVDASQGVEAQTLANTYLAIENGLELIPVLNKIDLPGAEPERVAEEVADLLGEPTDDILRISGKTGEGVVDVLEQLVAQVPPPSGDPDAPPRALIFDSEFDQYRGVIAYIRVVDGTFQEGRRDPLDGRPTPRPTSTTSASSRRRWSSPTQLGAGEVGFIITGIKEVSALAVGDTLTTKDGWARNPISSRCRATATCSRSSSAACFRSTPTSTPTCATRSRSSTLNDAALSWEPEVSEALGFGFRCGFLGLLHMDIVRERLEREYDIELMATMPSVRFEVTLTDDSEIEVHIPSDFPDPGRIAEIREPMIEASILTPKEYIGPIMELCQERRGTHKGMHYLSAERVQLSLRPAARGDRHRLLRRAEVAHEGLRVAGLRAAAACRPRTWSSSTSCSRGEQVDALSMVVHRDKAYDVGRSWSRSSRRRSRASSTTSRSRRRSARTSSPARPSRPTARTSSPAATAATSRASASCSRSRRRARSA